jgi:nucleoside 2-deoxyribosyltransferase
MRIYLAGKPEEHERFNEYATELRNYGFEVVSRWHENDQIANLVTRFQAMQDSQDQFVMKFMSIAAGQNIAGEEITDTDRKAVAIGPSSFELDDAFRHFKSDLKKADCVVADLSGASIEAGFALALGKKLVVIGCSDSPLIPFCIDETKVAKDWGDALAIAHNLRAAKLFGRRRALD